MRGVLIVVASIVAIGVLVTAVGVFIPDAHRSSLRARYAAPPDAVWSAVHGDASGYELVEARPGRYVVARIAGDGWRGRGARSGAWRWDVASAGDGGTWLTITESGEVRNPVLRFIAHFFLGYHGTMDRYMRDLGSRMGEEVEPERLPAAGEPDWLPAPDEPELGR